MGFNGRDSEILSSFSVQIEKGRTLSEKQLNICKKLLPKYWRQILEVIQSKEVVTV
jgi:hypothetical protein